MLRKIVAIVVGLLIAALAEFVGIMLAGAGHGWLTPSRASLLLFLAYPVTLWRWADPNGGSVRSDGMALVLGAVASLLVLVDTIAFEWEIFWRMMNVFMGPLLIVVWLVVWFGWQGLIVASMYRRERLRPIE